MLPLACVVFPQEQHIHESNVAAGCHVCAIAHEDVLFVGRGHVVQLQRDVRFPHIQTARLEPSKGVRG